MKRNFILVQGRLLPQLGTQLQYFPNNWEDEFPLIKKLGFNGIEWIYDKISENTNPILTIDGRKKIQQLSKKHDVSLENIVFDWFIEHPLLVDDVYSIEDKFDKLYFLCTISSQIGFKRIIFPILESNNIESEEKFLKFINFCKENLSPLLDKLSIEFHLESSLSLQQEKKLLDMINHDKFFVCFDMGNDASMGYDPISSIIQLNNKIGSVHIKDRLLHGTTVNLGDGNVDFHSVFSSLEKINFAGPYSFQAYRSQNSDNEILIQNYLKFINNIMDENKL
jgi:L-ribulose-5-phosphate 3-epimerase